MSDTTIGEGEEPERTRKPRASYLDPWRRAARTWLPEDSLMMTKENIQTVITKTIEWTEDDDVPEDERLAVKKHSYALLAREQTPKIIPRIQPKLGRKANQMELSLMNETYADKDGALMRLGAMTPKQVEDIVKIELFGQIREIREKWRAIEKIVKRCKYRNRPIMDQL